MKILSLFDGISVGQQALKELDIECEYYASEIDKYAIQITQNNFPETKQLGSVVGLKIDFQPDLLIGGSPCQDLSIAKKNREGLKGSRSGLFYEYVRILKEVRPKYFILENVNSMPREAKETITQELFGIEPIMINAALVSAQNRKRLFWVGKLVGDNYEKVEISQPQDKGILLKDILEDDVDEKYNINDYKTNWNSDRPIDENNNKYKTLRIGGDIPTIRVGHLNQGGQGDRIYSPNGKSVNLSANGGGRGAKTGLYCVGIIPESIKPKGNYLPRERVYSDEGKFRAVSTVNNQQPSILQNSTIRKLTPIECERLQSLPDNYAEGVSNTQRYKALGNAFNCEVIKHILKVVVDNQN